MANRKLTDTQLVILSTAGARDSGLVLPLPKSIRVNRGTQTIVLRGLLKKELIAERPAQPDQEVWESHADGSHTALVITDAGLTTVGIAPEPGGSETTPSSGNGAAGPGAQRSKGAPAAGSRTATDKAAKAAAPAEPGKDTQLGILITALRRKKGANVDEMTGATGWQAHSVRGAISGALKKKLGLSIVSEVTDGRGRVYRIDGDR